MSNITDVSRLSKIIMTVLLANNAKMHVVITVKSWRLMLTDKVWRVLIRYHHSWLLLMFMYILIVNKYVTALVGAKYGEQNDD